MTKLAPYSEGPLDASVAIVGEAAGEEELRKQAPFVGRAGRLLNTLLASSGLARNSLYLDNVFQFHPKDNNIEPYLNFIRSQKRTRVEEGVEFPFWQAQLARRLEQTSSNVIVACGRVALYALTGQTEIMKYRGSILESTLLPGRKVIPIIHPSATFDRVSSGAAQIGTPQKRKTISPFLCRYLIIFDLKRIKEQSTFPDISLLPRNIHLDPSFNQALDWLSEAEKEPLLAFDIEVDASEVSHISFATSATEALCIPFKQGPNNYWAPDQELILWARIAELLENPAITKLGQNLSFDNTFLFNRFGIRVNPFFDTMIAQAIIYPDFPKGLDFITSIWCDGEPYYKDDGKRWFKNPFGSDQAFQRYNAMDSAVVAEAWPKMREELKNQNNWECFLRQNVLVEPLTFMGSHGIRMDMEGMKKEADRCDETEASLREQLAAIIGPDFNPLSSPQCKTYFYVTKGIKPYITKGRITTDEKALIRIARRGYPEANLILGVREARKMKSTYFDFTCDPDGRLRCSFNPVGTVNGRVSSSKTIFGTGMNMQNQPKETQHHMYPEPGYIFISMDLSQAENRLVAYEAYETRMIEAFEKGIDIHKQTGALLHGISIEEVTPEQRQDGKTSNHGLNYDLGYKNFAMYNKMEEAKAKKIVERYHAVYPGIRMRLRAIREGLSSSRTLVNIFGRHRTFLEDWGDALFKEAYNFNPQSSVGDLLNYYGMAFVYFNKDPLFNPIILSNNIHDSIKFQWPLAEGFEGLVEVCSQIIASLERPLSLNGYTFSIPVDTKLGFSLDESKMLEWKAKHFHSTTPSNLALELADYVKKSQ